MLAEISGSKDETMCCTVVILIFVKKYIFAQAGSISKPPAHRFTDLKKGDFMDINPSNKHLGRCVREIRRLGPKSGQVQVVCEYQDRNFLYCAHLDNEEEIAKCRSKTGSKTNNIFEHLNSN